MRILSAPATVLLIALLTACSPPTVPDVTYFRLPPPTALAHVEKPVTSLPIEISIFSGDGIYAEQAMIYAANGDASALRAYHYQLWSDPPSRGLQARLIGMLRDAGVSTLVTDRLPASDQALRVRGKILRYERVKQDGGGYKIAVEFGIRVEQDDGEPLIEKSYGAEQTITDVTLDASVRAFGAATDQAFTKFYQDLTGVGGAHAG